MPSTKQVKKKPATAKASAVSNQTAALSAVETEALSILFKTLGSAHRLNILVFLSAGERNVRDIEETLRIRQPTLSQQLGELRAAGLVIGRRCARAVFYQLTPDLGRRAVDIVLAAKGTDVVSDRIQNRRRMGHSHSAAMFASVFS